ncbi:MAG: ABC transporter substrate-binding protein [Thermoproteota archaeon]
MKKENISISLILVFIILLSTIAPTLLFKSAPEVPNGPWVDEIAFFEEPDPNKAVDMLSTGAADVYLWGIGDPAVFSKIKSNPNLKYGVAYGTFNDIAFNPAEFKTGDLNPFADPTIREAMNYIIDRNYIANDIYGGLAIPKWVSHVSAFPDYGKLADVIKPLEFKYTYDFEKGKAIVYEEMAKLGATLEEGKWYYKGKPVVINLVIRIEDQRKQIGDYFASQLEKLGFTVNKLYKSSREASPIVYRGDPTLGQWNAYTEGWITGGISLDDSGDLGWYYTSLGAPTSGTFMAYARPDPLLYEIAQKLWSGQYKNDAERVALMAQGLPLALKDSLKVFVVDQISAFPYRSNIQVATDFGAGFNNPIWTRTIQFVGQTGGTVRAASPQVLVDPWNPVAGTNWLFDGLIQQGINDYAFITNPYTGKNMMNRVANYTVQVNSSGIEVPTNVIYGWDTKNNTYVFVKPNTFATTKVVAVYDTNLGTYHDGTPISVEDFIGLPALGFERVDPNSTLYDPSAVPNFESWRSWFIGSRIVNLNPLTIEYYGNYSNPIDPSLTAASYIGWPNFPWDLMEITRLAEEHGELAYSQYKATNKSIEWMNLIGGPSLSILEKWLDWAIQNKYVPEDLKKEAAFYGIQITPEEAVARYQALKNFYQTYGHFYVASGPFFLYKVDFAAHQAVIKAFRNYPYKADKFAFLTTPPIPEVSTSVPSQVVPGLQTVINVTLSYKGQPYPSNKVQYVKYLVTDPYGNMVAKGDANFVSEGSYTITLDPQLTGSFTPGTYTVLVIATSTEVAIPATLTTPFTVIPAIAYFQTLVNSMQAALSGRLSGIESSVTSLSSSVDSLKSSLSLAYGLAILSLLIAIAAVVLALRKPKT